MISTIYQSVRTVFRPLPFGQRLFIFIRCQVVPWRKIIAAFGDSPPKTLIDFGCGHGLFLHLMRSAYPATICWGVEHDEKKLATVSALDAREGVRYLSWADFTQNNPGKVDCVSIIDVLCCIPLNEWGGILSSASAQLDEGGMLFLKDAIDRPRWKYRVTNLQEIFAAKIFRFTKGAWPHHESVETYTEQLEKHGFKVERHERLDQGYPWSHYLFVARKVGSINVDT